MRKHLVSACILLVAVALLATACGTPATPTPTPRPTLPPTQPPPPTLPPTPVPPTAAPTPTVVPTAAPLSSDALKNAEYPVQGPASGKAKLVNGTYSEKVPNSTAQVVVTFENIVATGDLNGDRSDDAAVLISVKTGGTGTFYYLYGVINERGTPKPAAPELLGDRIKVKSLTIQGGEMVVNFLTQGPRDPMTNPTLDTTRKFRLQDNKLVSTTPVTPTAAAPTKAAVVATPRPAVTATPTPLRLPAPRGSIAYHKSDQGIDRVRALDLDRNVTTPLVDTGPVMDLTLGGSGTNAHLGEFSPDNLKFAFIQVTAAGGANNLKVLDFRSGATNGIFSDAGMSSPVWSPDGNRIAFVRTNSNQAFWAVSVINADGTGGVRDLFTNRGGEQLRGGLAWSKQNIFAVGLNTTGLNDVYTLFSDGGGLTNRTNNPADDSTPAFSPDGKQIAFTSTRDGRQQIYAMNADGSGVRRVSQSTVNDWSPSWSPDGNWIAFTSTRNNSTDIYIMDTRGGNVKQMTTGGGDRPMWSR
ncbi:MAG: PD40 domain-containing protein [Chloroflexi bacterium]|nr:PD40 domain-containing protein [Chloroflexota bacterium]